jgi:hypothetical protein
LPLKGIPANSGLCVGTYLGMADDDNVADTDHNAARGMIYLIKTPTFAASKACFL